MTRDEPGPAAQVRTTTSLPDALYRRDERVAQRLACTRNALYAEALGSTAAGRRLFDSGHWDW